MRKWNMNKYQLEIKEKMDNLVHCIYKITKTFPKSELFGITSQMNRASLSIILNYVEGYARQRILVRLNFLEISYGSLKELDYLLNFVYKEEMIRKEDFENLSKLTD